MSVVSVMLDMQLSFVHDKNEEGQLMYKLEPPIDVFVHFDGKRASDIPASRYNTRQLIVREMEAEHLRRMNGDSSGVNKSNASDILAAYTSTKPHQDLLGAVSAKPEVRDAVDFFGRVIVPKSVDVPEDDSRKENEAEEPAHKKRRTSAVYKYHEGFSNAVRVTKRVSDFLL